jgi:hypothetical protein
MKTMKVDVNKLGIENSVRTNRKGHLFISKKYIEFLRQIDEK